MPWEHKYDKAGGTISGNKPGAAIAGAITEIQERAVTDVKVDGVTMPKVDGVVEMSSGSGSLVARISDLEQSAVTDVKVNGAVQPKVSGVVDLTIAPPLPVGATQYQVLVWSGSAWVADWLRVAG